MRVRKFDIENGGPHRDVIEKPLTANEILSIPTGEIVLALGDMDGFRYSVALTPSEIDVLLRRVKTLSG